jgi:phage-related protein
MGWLGDLWNKAKNWVSGAYNTVKDVASNVWNKVSPYIRMIPIVGNKIAGGVEAVAGAVDKGAQGIAKGVTGDVVGAYGNIKDAYNEGKKGVEDLTKLKKGGMVLQHVKGMGIMEKEEARKPKHTFQR